MNTKLGIKYDGHIYAEGDLVEFNWANGGPMRARLVLSNAPQGLRSDTPDGEGYRPNVLTFGGDLCDGITNLRPVEEFSAEDLKEGGNITITGPLGGS